MHYLRYEYLSETYPRCNVFKTREASQIMAYTLHEDLHSIIKQSLEYPKYDHFFLLDESRFNFFRGDVCEEFFEKITHQSLNDFIKHKTDATKREHGIDGELVTTYIDTIYVDGEEKKFLIGQKGKIFFRLYSVYICKTALNFFNASYGNVLAKTNIHIIPQSFYTMMYLRDTLKKDNFVLLYITETYCKAIKISNGFYQEFHVLNLWMSSLKQMYKDNGVVQYRYKEASVIDQNPLAKELVVETLEFYSQLFCHRLQEKNMMGSDIIVISPITHNVHFIETFDKEYKKHTNNYILPFHHSTALNNFGREREPENMDVLVYMNREEKMKKLLLGEKE